MSDLPPTDDAEPPAKRIHTNSEEPVQSNNIRINKDIKLDRLHLYHLRHILDYLTMNDIIGSMKVSKQWQANILEYLRGSRFCFEYYHVPRTHFVPRLLGLVDDARVRHRRALPFNMSHGDFRQFQKNIEQLGPAIVAIVLDHLDEINLKIITENCPNLQDLMLVGMHSSWGGSLAPPPVDQQHERAITEEDQQCLQQLQLRRVSFVHAPDVTENYIREFLKSDSVEEIVICRNRSVEGRCLSCLKSNLKCLRLVACCLNFIHLSAIAGRLAALTVLDLSNNPSEILLSMHHLLDKTANLEFLFLNSYDKTNVGNEIIESLRRLGRLKHLSLCWNYNVSDAWLEAVAVGCHHLQTVDIETKMKVGRRRVVTADGVVALCRGARRLVHLGVAGHDIMDDAHVVACISVCAYLESLDLRSCARVSRALPALAGAAAADRARAAAAAAAAAAAGPLKPLCLRLARTALNRYQQVQAPKGLIFDFVDAPRIFRLV